MGKKSQVAGSVVAGFPSPAEQYLEPPLDLNGLLVKRLAATFFVKVEGDSMINAGIHDKDMLVQGLRETQAGPAASPTTGKYREEDGWKGAEAKRITAR